MIGKLSAQWWQLLKAVFQGIDVIFYECTGS
jgi:hypothetical protein